jgi:hypothetical protein
MQVTKAPFFSDYSLPMNNLQLMHGRIDHLKNNTFLDQENIFLFKDFFPLAKPKQTANSSCVNEQSEDLWAIRHQNQGKKGIRWHVIKLTRQTYQERKRPNYNQVPQKRHTTIQNKLRIFHLDFLLNESSCATNLEKQKDQL